MRQPASTTTSECRWISLWVVALLSLIAQLLLCRFFTFGTLVPTTIDMNPSNLWKFAYHFPPTPLFLVLNWFGVPNLPAALNPFSLAATLPPWFFFTAYAPLIGTCSLLVMTAFLRELELSRPAALLGGVVYAWQGDLLPFILPGHFAYITFWPFLAVAAWGALRAQRTGHWAYALISGAACGTMVGLPTAADRGGIACLFIAGLYLAPIICRHPCRAGIQLFHLVLCVVTAFLIALAPLLDLFQSQISGVKLGGVGGHSHFEETYKFCTQFSLGPWETFTFLAPGFFGWHSNSDVGPYWGWIGQTPGWAAHQEGLRNLNLAISTIGTTASILALIGICILFPWNWLGRAQISARSQFYARVILALGAVALVLSWGYHTPFYRPLFAIPYMDKWRNPLKWLEVTNFALVTLSAFGVQHFLGNLAPEVPEQQAIRTRLARLGVIAMGLFFFALLFSYPFAIYLARQLQIEGYQPGEVANIMDTLHTSLKVAFFIMALSCLLVYCIWHSERLREIKLINPLLDRLWQTMLQAGNLANTLAFGAALLCIGQLAWVTTHFVEPIRLSATTATNSLLEALENEGNQVRVSVAVEDPVLNILLLNQFNASGISSVDISAASRIPDDLNAFLSAIGSDRQRLWFLAGVKNVAVPQDFMAQLRADPRVAANIDHANGFTLIPTSSPDVPSHALIGMRDYLSKATLLPGAEYFPSGGEMLKRVADRAWDPRASILLDESDKKIFPNTQAGKTEPSAKDGVRIDTYNSTEITIHVESTKGGYVLINDQYDPDWEAQVNGTDARLLRADYLLRAVEVPPGESLITLRYVAKYHLGGLTFSVRTVHLLSDAAMLAAWIVAVFALVRCSSGVSKKRTG